MKADFNLHNFKLIRYGGMSSSLWEGPPILRSMGLTEICNLIGLPSVATPVQVVDGLPQGVQLIGPRYHEDLCFDAAEIIERQQGVFTPIEPRDIPSKI